MALNWQAALDTLTQSVQEEIAAGRMDPSVLTTVAATAGSVQTAAARAAQAAAASRTGAQTGATIGLALTSPWVLIGAAGLLFLLLRRR